MKKVSIVIPTRNAGVLFQKTLEGLKGQKYEGGMELVVIDSASTDSTVEMAYQYGARVISIHPEEFNHGLTRNRAIENASGEIIVLISQDAVPGDPYLISNFVAAFDDEKVAGAYARQLPRENADLITQRNLKNWFTGREQEEVRWIQDRTVYNSLSPMERYFFCNFDNVCSAIHRSVWQTFPFNASDFGEDIEWAQRVLEAGWKIAYCPSAYVFHSHNRSMRYEFERNRLCHQVLYRQFGIEAVPSWKQVILSTWVSSRADWKYILQHERHFGTLIKMMFGIPFLNFSSVYGQYIGLMLGRSNLGI